MFTPIKVRTATALALTALLVACGDRNATGLADEDESELPAEEPAAGGMMPVGPVIAWSVESEVIIGGGDDEDDGGETLPEGGGDSPFSPDAPPVVGILAPSSVEAGSGFTFQYDALSFAPDGATYKVVVFPGYVGPGTYSAYVWQGTVTSSRTTISVPAGGALLGTTRLRVAVTNANGTTTVREDLEVLPRRPRFTGADMLPATRVAGNEWFADLSMAKPAQPTAPDYVLPLTVNFGDGRTETFDWDIVEEWSHASKTIPMTWYKPGTYSVTFKVAATSAPAYSSTHTESITILPNPAWPYITDFEGPDEVVPGRTYQITFNPGGPEYPGELFQVTTYRENGSHSTTFVQPGEPASIVYNWPSTFGEAWQTTIVSGTVEGVLRADTIRWSAEVVPEPIIVGSFTGPEDVSFGEEASFSFRAHGGPGPYTATITYGDGSEPTVLNITPNTLVTRTHTWAESGLWDLNIVVDNGATSTTLSEDIAILRPRPTVDDVSIPDRLSFGESSAIRFVANDVNDVEAMLYEILLSNDQGQSASVDDPATKGVPVELPILGPDFNVVYEIRIVVSSLMNGLVLESDTAFHTLTIEDLMCSAGSYREGYECVAAPAGYHVPADGATEAVACVPGTYQDQEGQTSCIDAPAGSVVSLPAATQPELCPVGTWQSQAGATTCNNAQPGHFVDQVGATQATPCAPGTFQPAAGSSSCDAAAPGSFVAGSGATEVTPCAPGTYQPASGSSSCDAAVPGSYVAGSGATDVTPCAPGTFQPAPGSTSCDAAAPGSFVAGSGATAVTPCAPGTFQPAAGSTSCVAAAPGSYVAVSGATQAEVCQPGTFQPAAGSISCDAAAPGSYVSISGATEAELCQPGTFQPGSGQTGCVDAPVGSYVDVMGAATASPCPLTTSTEGTGATSAEQCIPLGQVALPVIEQAADEGTLVPAANGNGGQQQFNGWVDDVSRSFEFLEGPQRQAGCSGVRNALAKADGNPSPKDVVTGPARAGVEAALRRILEEYGC